MDLGGRPEGNDISGDDSVVNNGIHHDRLNENLEETWSALGEQDERSGTDSDPGMLPPPIPQLATSVGSIIGQPINQQRMSDLSILRAPNLTITAVNINQRGSEEAIEESMAGRRKFQQLEDIKNPKLADAGFRTFSKKGQVVEDLQVAPITIQKRKPSKSSLNDTKSILSKGAGSSIQKEEEDVQLDMFFNTMYNTTNKLPLMKQIEVRREIRQLVMNAEKKEQIANRPKKSQGSTDTPTKKSRFSIPKW